MTHAIRPTGALLHVPAKGEVVSPTGTPSFADTLRLPRPEIGSRSGTLVGALRDTAGRLARDQRYVDQAIRRLGRGGVVETGELLALQAGVYRYSQEIELATRIVDKSLTALRQTVQSQG
jgi:hypothetical protein